jgi:natural product biosynthesis luciferase-like monooxygenase protein
MKFSLFFFASGDDAANQYQLLLSAAQLADSLGFEAVWTPERHFHEFGAPFANPAVTGAAVAATTSRLGVRAGSVVLPLHDPLRVAEEWAMVDHLSGGRAGLAIASGWNPRDFVLAPTQFADRKASVARGVEELRALWRGESIVRTGPHGEVEVRTYPSPARTSPDLWITASGSPQTFELAGELGCGVLTHLLGQSFDGLEANLARYGDAVAEHGHDPGSEHVVVMMHTLVGHDNAAADAVAKKPLTNYMRTSMDLFAVDEPNGPPIDELSEQDAEDLLDLTYRSFVRDRCLIGSVDTCEINVKRVAELGVDEIACLIDFGAGVDEVLDGLKWLAELKDRCSDL